MAKVKQDRYTMMLEAPIPPLICRLAVPTIISMLVTSIYNMADTYFVGRISTSASAAARPTPGRALMGGSIRPSSSIWYSAAADL